MLCATATQSERATAAAGALALAAVVLLLVALIAAAGFVASPSAAYASSACWLRSARPTSTCGWCCWPTGPRSACAAVAGTATGLVAWIAVAGRLETLAGHRIDRWSCRCG